MISDKHFNAILAKNAIARHIATKGISIEYIIERLKDIELYIGESNQPSVEDTYKEANA